MRKKRNLVVITALALLCIGAACGAVQAQNDTIAAIQKMIDNEGSDKGSPTTSITASAWKQMPEWRQIEVLLGLYKGYFWGSVVTRSKSISAKKLRYIVDGWNMPASMYVSEVDALFAELKSNTKSLSFIAAMVLAEAKFAESAGQKDRAIALRRYSTLFRSVQDDLDDDIFGLKNDGKAFWKKEYELGYTNALVEGYLAGIHLQRLAIDADCNNAYLLPFRIGQIQSQMSMELEKNDLKCSVNQLLLIATKSLLETARVSK